MPSDEKPLEWIGSSRKDLTALPADVRRFFGITTPKEEMDIIHARLKIAEAFAKELRK
jgi:phage-related protein